MTSLTQRYEIGRAHVPTQIFLNIVPTALLTQPPRHKISPGLPCSGAILLNPEAVHFLHNGTFLLLVYPVQLYVVIGSTEQHHNTLW